MDMIVEYKITKLKNVNQKTYSSNTKIIPKEKNVRKIIF